MHFQWKFENKTVHSWKNDSKSIEHNRIFKPPTVNYSKGDFRENNRVHYELNVELLTSSTSSSHLSELEKNPQSHKINESLVTICVIWKQTNASKNIILHLLLHHIFIDNFRFTKKACFHSNVTSVSSFPTSFSFFSWSFLSFSYIFLYCSIISNIGMYYHVMDSYWHLLKNKLD